MSSLPVRSLTALGSEAEGRLSAELENLTYAVSHDLRAPLRAVLGYASALDEDYGARLDDEGRRLLSIVSGEAARATKMLDALLVLSRLGSKPLVSETIDMTALAREVAFEQAPSSDELFAIDVLPDTRGDPELLRLIWSHLLSNAVTATNRRPDPRVTISATRECTRVVYHVCDNGVGFDMTYSDKLFRVFQKLHHAADFPGLGAGLAIVGRIVHRHEGTFWAEARTDAGASFSFALPLERT